MNVPAPAAVRSNSPSAVDPTIDEVFELDIADLYKIEPEETEAAPAAEVNPFRVYVSSVLGATTFFLLAVGLPVWFAYGPAWGAAVGAMTAAWVGPGFGVMIGGARMVAMGERGAAVAV